MCVFMILERFSNRILKMSYFQCSKFKCVNFLKGSLSLVVEIVQIKVGQKSESFLSYKAFYGKNSQFEDTKT